MSQPRTTAPADTDAAPPFLGSWRNIYVLVLLLHLGVVILFYLFSRAYA